MPKRGALALVTTVLAVVLLFSFKPADPTTTLTGGLPGAGLPTDPPLVAAPVDPTPTPLVAGPPAPTSRPGTTSHATTPPAQPAPSPASGNTGGSGGTNVSGTFTGKAVDTPYGTVQIALVVQGGKITDVQELQLPNDRRLSQQISAQAGPMLRDEVIRAQSDNINGVSGASYTSYGFYLSLQSALQQM